MLNIKLLLGRKGKNILTVIFDISGFLSYCFVDILQVLEGIHGLGVVKTSGHRT